MRSPRTSTSCRRSATPSARGAGAMRRSALTPFLQGETPPWWRDAAHWEYDWRSAFVPYGPHPWPWDRRLEQQHLTVLRNADASYVQFADAVWCAFDLARRSDLAHPALGPRIGAAPGAGDCWCGARRTPSARSPACCSPRAASPLAGDARELAGALSRDAARRRFFWSSANRNASFDSSDSKRTQASAPSSARWERSLANRAGGRQPGGWLRSRVGPAGVGRRKRR